MAYKITFHGGSREDVRKAVEAQSQSLMGSKSMSEESKASIMKLIDALPGTHLSGTIQDTNTGVVNINVTARTQAAATIEAEKGKSASVDNSNRPMEGAAGNRGESTPRATTGAPVPAPTSAAGPVVKPTTSGVSSAVDASKAAAAEVKPDTSPKPTATGGTPAGKQ